MKGDVVGGGWWVWVWWVLGVGVGGEVGGGVCCEVDCGSVWWVCVVEGMGGCDG